MTRNNLIDQLEIEIKSLSDDDVEYSKELLGQYLDIGRAFLIHRDYERNKYKYDTVIHTISCLNLIEEDITECPECKQIDSNCVWLKTEIPLPEHIELISVLTLHDKPLQKIKPNDTYVTFLPNYKAGSKYITYFIKGRYIYVKYDLNIKNVKVLLIPTNPEDVFKINKCPGDCYSREGVDYIPEYLIGELITYIIREKFQILNKPEDEINNTHG